MLIYFGIFLFKIIEDALATLRLIVVSNGKKLFGAVLQFFVAVIRIILTGTVLVNFTKDWGKIIAFSLGGFVGSYLGSEIERKIALGTNSFIVKTSNIKSLTLKLDQYNFNYLNINTNTILVISPRKHIKKVVSIIKSIDKNAYIISEKVKLFSHL